MRNNSQKGSPAQAGVSLIITFFIMIIILVIVLVISNLAYSQIKVIRNIGNSVISFYAADSGVEKVLYYDRKVIPILENGLPAKRGLCSMIDPVSITNTNPCITDPSPSDANADHSIYCNATSKAVIDATNPDGCDPDVCNNCEVDFSTAMSSDNQKNYAIKARVTPGPEGNSIDFSVDSKGSYESVSRAVNLFMTKSAPQQIINVVYAYATPRSVENGVAVNIETRVQSPNGISSVTAYIKDSIVNDWSGNPSSILPCVSNSYNGTCSVALTCGSGFQDRVCSGSQILPAGAYYVDLDIIDGHNIEFIDENIQPAP